MNCNFIGMGNVGCSSAYCYVWIPHDFVKYQQVCTRCMSVRTTRTVLALRVCG